MAYNYVNNLGSYPSIPNYQFTNFPYQNVNTGTGNVGGNVVAPISSAVPTLPNSNPAIECDWVTGEDGARSYRDILPGRSKDLCEIEEKSQHKDQEEYSMRSYRGGRGYGYVYDYPMADYGHGSYRNMNYDGNSNYANGRNGSYSRNGSEQMVNQLSEMWENASSEQERRAIKECIDKLNA